MKHLHLSGLMASTLMLLAGQSELRKIDATQTPNITNGYQIKALNATLFADLQPPHSPLL